MSIFGQILSSGMSLLKISFTIWGHTFSMWQVFVFSIVAGIVFDVVWEVIDGD